MYELLSLLSGFLVAVMLWLNGGLTQRYGVYTATVLIHLVGFLLSLSLLLCKREWPFKREESPKRERQWTLYTGGALGVFIVVFMNRAYGQISVSAMLALGLLGQSLAALVVDQFGLLQMPKKSFRPHKIWGLLLLAAGIGVMVREFTPAPLLFALLSGVILVLARTQNARLAARIGLLGSSFFNYLTGLLLALPLGAYLGRSEPFLGPLLPPTRLHYYLGGLVGLLVVLLSNHLVRKISAFYFSLLTFIGQVGAGLLIDAWLEESLAPRTLWGGLLVSFALLLDLALDQRRSGRGPSLRPDPGSKPD